MTVPLPASGSTSWYSHYTQLDTLTRAMFNAVNYGADKTGVADSGTAIQNAINAASSAGGGTVYLPAGVYLLNAALIMKSRVTLVGDGVAYGDGAVGTRLYQNSSTAACLTAADQRYMAVQNLTIIGTGGTTNTAVSFTRSTNADIAGLRFTRVQITGFGTGMDLSNPITSVFDQVEIDSCTVGFYLHGVLGAGGSAGTSCAFLNCYANGCTQTGFRLDNMTYCSFTSCAADSCGIGYELIEAGTQGIAFLGCGSESLVSGGANYPGLAWKINAAVGVSLDGCFTYNLPNNSIWVTGNASAVRVGGFSENSPQAGVVNSIKVDTGCSAVLEAVTTVKPLSLATGTTSQIKVNGTSAL